MADMSSKDKVTTDASGVNNESAAITPATLCALTHAFSRIPETGPADELTDSRLSEIALALSEQPVSDPSLLSQVAEVVATKAQE